MKISAREVLNSNGRLTNREKEVLLSICLGKCNKNIADDLNIAPNTVKKHICNAYRKLGLNNRFQATLWTANHL